MSMLNIINSQRTTRTRAQMTKSSLSQEEGASVLSSARATLTPRTLEVRTHDERDIAETGSNKENQDAFSALSDCVAKNSQSESLPSRLCAPEQLGRMATVNFGAEIDVVLESGSQEINTFPLGVDPASGRIWAALPPQVRATTKCKCCVYVTTKATGGRFLVGTCTQTLQDLKIDPEAEKMGWQVQGRELVPPLVEGVTGDLKLHCREITRLAKDSQLMAGAINQLRAQIAAESCSSKALGDSQEATLGQVHRLESQQAEMEGQMQAVRAEHKELNARMHAFGQMKEQQTQALELLEDRTSTMFEAVTELKSESSEEVATLRHSMLQNTVDVELLSKQVETMQLSVGDSVQPAQGNLSEQTLELWNIAEHKAEMERLRATIVNQQGAIDAAGTRLEQESSSLRAESTELRADVRELLLYRIQAETQAQELKSENENLKTELQAVKDTLLEVMKMIRK